MKELIKKFDSLNKEKQNLITINILFDLITIKNMENKRDLIIDLIYVYNSLLLKKHKQKEILSIIKESSKYKIKESLTSVRANLLEAWTDRNKLSISSLIFLIEYLRKEKNEKNRVH